MAPATEATPRSRQSHHSDCRGSTSRPAQLPTDDETRSQRAQQHRYRELTLDDLKETLDWFFEERPARKKEEDEEVDMLHGVNEKTRRIVLNLGKQLARREARQAAIRRETWSPERIRRFEEKRAWKIANPRAAFEEMWEEIAAEKAAWSPERRRRYEERVVQLQTGCGLVNERGEVMECRECREGREERERQERREERRRREVEEIEKQEREAKEKERGRIVVEETKREIREEMEKENRERQERQRRRDERAQRRMLARMQEWRSAAM